MCGGVLVGSLLDVLELEGVVEVGGSASSPLTPKKVTMGQDIRAIRPVRTQAISDIILMIFVDV